MLTKNNIIAIDPGKGGGIAYSLREGEVHSCGMHATTGDTIDLLRNLMAISKTPPVCYMESMVKFIAGKTQTGASTIVYGHNYGCLEGALMALSFRLVFVRPQEWQRELGLGTKKGRTDRDWKNHLKAEAQRLFPTQDVTLRTADALLILEYARRQSYE